MEIGFIGLGQMGRGMAARLVDRGHALTVWNRTAGVAEALAARGAAVARRAEDTLDAEVVITMLADDAAVRAVWLDSALVARVPADRVHLNMASVSPRLARQLASAHAERGTSYVSAPVFGRPSAAVSGELDIVAAGPRAGIERCAPLFDALGRRWFDLGAEAAHANVVKTARNFVLATIIEALGEAFALVAGSGVDEKRFLEIITSSSMSAPAYKNYGRFMLDPPRDVTFPLKLGLKDVELALALAADTGVSLPTGELLRRQHIAAIDAGYGEKDWASLGNYVAAAARARRRP